MFKRWVKDIQWMLVLAVLLLSSIGLLFIHSATHLEEGNFIAKQMIWMGIGFSIFFGVTFLGYRTFLGISNLIYLAAILLLFAVMAVGGTHLGAQRWLHIGPIVIQPSEFAKLAAALVLANYLGAHPRIENEAKTVVVASLFILFPFFLILKQPDLGTSLLFIPLMASVLLVWGLRYRYFIAAGLMGIISASVLWVFLKEYQKNRLHVFLNPELDPLGAGYTALQSKIAVGSGGLFGKGYLAGTQIQLDFVPEHHTDFIYCVIGEEWGFFGSLILLLCYGLLFRACFRVIENTTDMKAKLLATGLVAIIFSQVFINIGMSFGLMPITGLTLPLVSYGGSSFVMTCISLGLILSIYKERSIF